MKIVSHKFNSSAIRFSLSEDGKEIGHAYLYLIKNDLHPEPYGLLEDIFIKEGYQGKGRGTKLLKQVIKRARKEGCYKLLATCRQVKTRLHSWYQKLGFKKFGLEFRMEF